MSTTKREPLGTKEDRTQRARAELDDAVVYAKALLKLDGPFPPGPGLALRIQQAEKAIVKKRSALARLTLKQRKQAARDAQAMLDIPPGGSGRSLGGSWGRRGDQR